MADTISFAKKLLGSVLVHDSGQGLTSGIITEVECYLKDDPACHAYNGITKRNAPMFGPFMSAYIYFIYGMHYCFNIVTNKGEAVLIRALKPLEGIDIMIKRRGTDKHLCDGPAKLVQAMGITPSFNSHLLTEKPLYVLSEKNTKQVHVSTRIGITKGKDLPYRFFID